jgi:acetyl esterase/lipase
VIVSYYGNQLMGGDKSEDAYVGRRFAAAGFVTVVANYRLSPAVSHPAHVQDAAASFAWVKRHIADYGGNADQVFLIGYSAGAYLAACFPQTRAILRHTTFARATFAVPFRSVRFYWVEGRGVAPDRDKSVWGNDRNVWVDASPAHHRLADAPPMLISNAERDEDWRREQNVGIAAAMKEAGHKNIEIVMIPIAITRRSGRVLATRVMKRQSSLRLCRCFLFRDLPFELRRRTNSV